MLCKELVVLGGSVILVEIIYFNNSDELLGIGRRGGIAAAFQSLCPSFVVGGAEGEEHAVALRCGEELTMVLVAFVGIVVGTKTLAAFVVIVIGGASRPSVTFYSEVVVCLLRQLAIPCPTLKEPLGKGDAGGNAVFQHFLDGKVFILVDIRLVTLIPFGLCHSSQHSPKG